MSHVLVPITLFLCLTYGFKLVVDARMRWLLLRQGGSDDAIRAMLRAEETQRGTASLRWGIVLVTLGIAFAIIETMGWTRITAGAVAVLAAATGIGNLAYFVIARRLAGGQ